MLDSQDGAFSVPGIYIWGPEFILSLSRVVLSRVVLLCPSDGLLSSSSFDAVTCEKKPGLVRWWRISSAEGEIDTRVSLGRSARASVECRPRLSSVSAWSYAGTDGSRYIDSRAWLRFSCNFTLVGFVFMSLLLVMSGHPDLGWPRRDCAHLLHFGALRPGMMSGETSRRAALPAGDDWAERRVGGDMGIGSMISGGKCRVIYNQIYNRPCHSCHSCHSCP